MLCFGARRACRTGRNTLVFNATVVANAVAYFGTPTAHRGVFAFSDRALQPHYKEKHFFGFIEWPNRTRVRVYRYFKKVKQTARENRDNDARACVH